MTVAPEIAPKYRRHLRILYSVFAVIVVVTLPYGALETSWDSPTYFAAWDVLKSGRIDILRTPLYPAFIGIISDLVGSHLRDIAIATVQYLIFGISIKYFYLTALRLTRAGRIPLYTTLLYILSPSTSLWAGSVMTESLSISIIVMWVYTLVRIWQDGYRGSWGAISAVLLLLLLMLRPAFVYLLAPCVCYAVIYYLCRSKLYAVRLSLIFIIPFALLAAYCMMFKATYGILSPSCVSVYNALEILRLDGATDIPSVTDPALRASIQAYLDTEDVDKLSEFYAMQQQFGLQQVQVAVTSGADNGILHYPKVLVGHLYRMTYLPVLNPYSAPTPLSYVLIYLSLSGRTIILLTVLFIIDIFIAFSRGQRPWIECILAVMVISNIFTSLIGAQSDWIRLCVASAPVLFLAIGIMASRFTIYRPTHNTCIDSDTQAS